MQTNENKSDDEYKENEMNEDGYNENSKCQCV